jgi:ribonuclease HII
MNDWSIQKIEQFLKVTETLTPSQKRHIKGDARKGVQLAYERWARRVEKQQERLHHFYQLQEFEQTSFAQGFERIAGVDEVGRGPLAGPVVAGAVILKKSAFLPESGLVGLNDSKQLTKKEREHFIELIKSHSHSFGIGLATSQEIDEINIYQATKLAMKRAISQLQPEPDHLFIDALDLPLSIPQTPIVKGDARSLTIAAASVLAKEFRDALMVELDDRYPGYNFSSHAGYATKAHLEAVEKLGPCPEHRLSFAPFKIS